MNLSELKSLNSGYDTAHRETGKVEQESPCTCQIKAKLRLGGASYPSLISREDADPDCELHFPWMQEDDSSRQHAMRYWYAGYQVGYDTAYTTGYMAAMEAMGYLPTDDD
jgi:hypothetical protein